MAFGLTIEKKDDVYHLSGHIDEVAEFREILHARAEPLRLNLRRVQSINSLGLRRLIDCMRQLDGRNVELHECPPVFVEAVNVIPLVVGGQSKISRIKSVYLQFNCNADHETTRKVAVRDVVIDDEVTLPAVICTVCGADMDPDLDSELHEFFFFLMA